MEKGERAGDLGSHQLSEAHNGAKRLSYRSGFDRGFLKPLRSPLDDFDAILKSISRPDVAPALRQSLHNHIQTHFRGELTARAIHLLYDQQPKMSALSPTAFWIRMSLIFLAVTIPIGFILAPTATMTMAFYTLLPYCFASMVLKGFLTFASLKRDKIHKPLERFAANVIHKASEL